MTTSSPSSRFATQTEERSYPTTVRKVILEQPPTPAASDLVATNLVAVLISTGRLLLHVAVIGFVFFFAFFGGMLKAHNRGRGKSW